MQGPPHRDPQSLQPGELVAGRYRILGSAGTGGFGCVYRAMDGELGEVVALKFLKLDPDESAEALEKASREIRATRRVSHPNVIRTHDIGESDGLRFISMEFVSGQSLTQILNLRGKLPLGEAMEIFRQAAGGVGAAHRRGVVHRDLKPSNVLLDEEGVVKVVDFGIASFAGSRGVTATGSLVGTPAYMSPEQVEGHRADERSDIYSLGIILYEMLAGNVPFLGDTPLATAMARLRMSPKDPCLVNPALPPWAGTVVLRCLEREPGQRYSSVEDLLDTLDAMAEKEEGRPTLTLRHPAEVPTKPRITVARSRAVRLGLLAAVAVLLLVGGALAVPSLWRSFVLSKTRPLLEDGVAGVVVMDFDEVVKDNVSHIVAAMLPEKMRARLSERSDVRVFKADVSDAPAIRPTGIEQRMEGRVVHVGNDVKVQVSVTDLARGQIWLSFERSAAWDEAGKSIDVLADEIESAYADRLEKEKEREDRAGSAAR